MRTERFTTRANEAIAAAQQLAEGEGNPELTALHLLLSLIDQPEGVVATAIERIGKDPAAVAAATREELAMLPKVSGGAQLTLGADARRILSDAHPLAERMRDEYVSTEHLLLAIIEDGSGNAAQHLLRAQGIEGASVLEALTSIRGNQRVTSENPEATYEALEKYGRDLTEAARKGLLDPVIAIPPSAAAAAPCGGTRPGSSGLHDADPDEGAAPARRAQPS